jgi:hypothetical protein
VLPPLDVLVAEITLNQLDLLPPKVIPNFPMPVLDGSGLELLFDEHTQDFLHDHLTGLIDQFAATGWTDIHTGEEKDLCHLDQLSDIQMFWNLVGVFDKESTEWALLIIERSSQDMTILQLGEIPLDVWEHIHDLDVVEVWHVTIDWIDTEGIKGTVIELLERDDLEVTRVLIANNDAPIHGHLNPILAKSQINRRAIKGFQKQQWDEDVINVRVVGVIQYTITDIIHFIRNVVHLKGGIISC